MQNPCNPVSVEKLLSPLMVSAVWMDFSGDHKHNLNSKTFPVLSSPGTSLNKKEFEVTDRSGSIFQCLSNYIIFMGRVEKPDSLLPGHFFSIDYHSLYKLIQ